MRPILVTHIRLVTSLIACVVALIIPCIRLEAQKPSVRHHASNREVVAGVTIHWTLERGMFPQEWISPPENMHATPLHASELPRALRALRTTLQNYPPDLLRSNLKDVYLVDELYDVGELVGGMENADDRSIYLCNDRETTDSFLISVFHHEFAHLLLDHNETLFRRKDWAKLNKTGFHYGKGGIESIKKREDSDKPEERYWRDGFLCQYAKSDIDEDFASLAEYLFTASPSFWNSLERYPILKRKVNRVHEFYYELDSHCSPEWFQHSTYERERLRASR